MADLQIEDLVRGVSTGEYVRKVGSQFGFTSPQDTALSVQRRVMWMGRDGVVSLQSTPTYVQVSVGRPVGPKEEGVC
jgi:hypothetical protein